MKSSNFHYGNSKYMRSAIDIQSLRTWFVVSKRQLPWRRDPTPYEVWISEVMLQQTQASVVIPYFERWMETFPTIEDLARAPLDQVIKLWEGLGYYARARSLHSAAKVIVDKFNGIIPSTQDDLLSIKGIGPYTAGAILSFAFHKKAAAVDGNVLRVVSRLFCIQGDISKGKMKKTISDLTWELLPDAQPWIIMEALIELGATICGKTPKCSLCPLNKECRAYSAGLEKQIPNKKSRPIIERLYREVAIVFSKNAILLREVPQGRIMHGLHEFPYFQCEPIGSLPSQVERLVCHELGVVVSYIQSLDPVQQGFTRYRATLFPKVYKARNTIDIEGFKWVEKPDWGKCAFSSGHRKIFEAFFKVADNLM